MNTPVDTPAAAATDADSGSKIPRSPTDDYTRAQADARRRFAEAKSGARLDHVGRYSFDPAILPGNIENFVGVAQVPIGPRRTAADRGRARARRLLRAAGDHRGHAGGELQPRHAAAHRMRRRARPPWSTQAMQRSPVFIMDDALAARDARPLGRRTPRPRSARRPRRPRAIGKLVDIEQYAVGPMRHLRFNYTTGDAAGQNLTGKATLAACEWISAHYPGGARFILSGNMDTDKKHSRINMLQTRGRRVVAEAIVTQRGAEADHGRRHARAVPRAPDRRRSAPSSPARRTTARTRRTA